MSFLAWSWQGYCSYSQEDLTSTHSPSISPENNSFKDKACDPVNKIPTDPPQDTFRTNPYVGYVSSGTAGTSLPSPSIALDEIY